MTAVLSMAPQDGGQAGYCGNFNGDATDDFQPPEAGTVPENLVAAWNIPIGEGLEPVPEELDLFRMSTALRELAPLLLPPAVAGSKLVNSSGGVRRDPVPACTQDQLTEAKAACNQIKDP